MSEHELIQSAKRGESEGVVGLLKMHAGIVLIYCRKVGLILFDHDEEIINQIGRIAIWKAAKGYDGRAKFTTYLGWKLRAEIGLHARARVKSKKAIDFCRFLDGDQVEIGNVIGCGTPEYQWENDARAEEVEEALSELHPRDRFILMQRAKGCTLREVGAVLGICKERVRQRQAFATKAIREKYAIREKEPIGVA